MSKSVIESGKAVLGIEFGSTRIKAVLVDDANKPIASGSHEWENQLKDGIWTYSIDMIWEGLQHAYKEMTEDVEKQYGVKVEKLAALGFSAMMHGYMAFGADDEILVPFRTWRNAITEEASEKLTKLVNYNIPQRWSIAHLYQAILNGEDHVKDIKFQTTLAGYIHWKLTGRKVLGVGEASGMFPIDIATGKFNQTMVDAFNKEVEGKGYPWKLLDIFPEVLTAGENAGELTAEGAKLLDPTGTLQAGCPLCPPEGDAGTGMVATNSVARRTGNVSAGTSVFSMVSMQYSTGVDALCDVSIRIEKGEFVFVVGKSGSGKSTFIKLLLKELNPSEGRIFVAGRQVTNLSRKQVSLYRRQIGVVFQDFRLLKNKTVYENIEFAQQIIGMNKREIARNVAIMLEMVGLKGKENAYPGELSGGEQQRVAIARALINNPAILLADEPTGNLDPQMAWEIMMLLQEINKMGTTVVVVTHNNDVVDIMKKRVVTLDKGSIVSDEQEGGYQYERD